MFVYSAKRAYPDAYVRIFAKDELKPAVRDILSNMKTMRSCNTKWDVKEGVFSDIKKDDSTCNSLRFLIPEKYFKGFTHVYFTDVDFIFLPHTPSLLAYHKKIMKRTGVSMSVIRSALRRPRREGVPHGWIGHHTRLIGGMVMVENPGWFRKTSRYRRKYLSLISKNRSDEFDDLQPCSYREYDEVMLYRICLQSGIPIPNKRNHHIGDIKFNSLYRDIHLGDFKFGKRRKQMDKKPRIRKENIKGYKKLQKDPCWCNIVKQCTQHHEIEEIMSHLNSHVKKCSG